MATEQQIQKKMISYLEGRGCYVVKVISASKAGVHDLIGSYEGQFFSIEVKTPEKAANVSKLQEYNLDKVIASGGHSIIAWDVDMVEDFINGILL